ncbi:MAG: twin-arginine translocase subunit TatC [Planctomycetes bacterium]|nr:twin-arginine translocase subunit TatC [Planctomycetota bacterium]
MSALAGAQSDDPFAHTRMSLGEHLNELRKRLFRGVLGLAVSLGVCLYFNEQIVAVVLQPYHQMVARLNDFYRTKYEERVQQHPEQREKFFAPDGSFRFEIDERLVALAPTESMWFVLKVAGYASLVLGGPFLLWQLWQFVAAGLYSRERRWVVYFFPPALFLFAVGVLFSYYVIVPYGMFYSLQSVDLEFVKPTLGLDFYFDFLFTLCLSMGLVFQLPILMTFVGLVGLVPAEGFAKVRPYFAVAAFAIAAFLTPGPDVFSQVAMAAPMVLLYEIGILGARFAGRRRSAVAR